MVKILVDLPEERLFDLCRWNRSNDVADFLSANPKLDIFCGDGKFFNLAISAKLTIC